VILLFGTFLAAVAAARSLRLWAVSPWGIIGFCGAALVEAGAAQLFGLVENEMARSGTAGVSRVQVTFRRRLLS